MSRFGFGLVAGTEEIIITELCSLVLSNHLLVADNFVCVGEVSP